MHRRGAECAEGISLCAPRGVNVSELSRPQVEDHPDGVYRIVNGRIAQTLARRGKRTKQ